MKISYAITVCNEFIEIQSLLGTLLQHKRPQDEIVVLFDGKNGSMEVRNFLKHYSQLNWVKWTEAEFANHFADWKNQLTEMCSGDYIFQIDADELITESLIRTLPEILKSNNVDVIRVPRVNTVSGLTREHINKWGWYVDPRGWVNFPDYQWRLYKKSPEIKWINKVHEVLTGFKTISEFPADPEYALIHNKTIERQETQNGYYETL